MASQPKENPFLPAHIRARLTGGRVPKIGEQPSQTESAAGEEPRETAVPTQDTTVEVPHVASALSVGKHTSEVPQSPDQRQRLIDRLVAKQLPELERQLRARIEKMLDELEAKQ